MMRNKFKSSSAFIKIEKRNRAQNLYKCQSTLANQFLIFQWPKSSLAIDQNRLVLWFLYFQNNSSFIRSFDSYIVTAASNKNWSNNMYGYCPPLSHAFLYTLPEYLCHNFILFCYITNLHFLKHIPVASICFYNLFMAVIL